MKRLILFYFILTNFILGTISENGILFVLNPKAIDTSYDLTEFLNKLNADGQKELKEGIKDILTRFDLLDKDQISKTKMLIKNITQSNGALIWKDPTLTDDKIKDYSYQQLSCRIIGYDQVGGSRDILLPDEKTHPITIYKSTNKKSLGASRLRIILSAEFKFYDKRNTTWTKFPLRKERVEVSIAFPDDNTIFENIEKEKKRVSTDSIASRVNRRKEHDKKVSIETSVKDEYVSQNESTSEDVYATSSKSQRGVDNPKAKITTLLTNIENAALGLTQNLLKVSTGNEGKSDVSNSPSDEDDEMEVNPLYGMLGDEIIGINLFSEQINKATKVLTKRHNILNKFFRIICNSRIFHEENEVKQKYCLEVNTHIQTADFLESILKNMKENPNEDNENIRKLAFDRYIDKIDILSKAMMSMKDTQNKLLEEIKQKKKDVKPKK